MITKEFITQFKTGDKITLYKLNIYNETFPIHCTLVDDTFNEWGYYKRGSGWGLYRLSDDDFTCYEMLVRLYKKRSTYRFRTGFEIVDIKKGWVL